MALECARRDDQRRDNAMTEKKKKLRLKKIHCNYILFVQFTIIILVYYITDRYRHRPTSAQGRKEDTRHITTII